MALKSFLCSYAHSLPQQIKAVVNLDAPYGIAINNNGEIVVSEWGSHRVSILTTQGNSCRTFGSYGDEPEQMTYPAGIATAGKDIIYVSSQHKLQKFADKRLKKCVGKKGVKKEEFDDPRGLAVYNNMLYVIDRKNHRVQVFDLDLNFVRIIGSRGMKEGEFDEPLDVKFSTDGNMYVAEFNNKRVQVLDSNDQCIRMIGQNHVGLPTGLHVVNGMVYVSDFTDDRVVVYKTTGEYVTTIGVRGRGVEQLRSPYCITSNENNLFVCDSANNRIYIFGLL